MGAAYGKLFTQVLRVHLVTLVIYMDNSLDNEILGLSKNALYGSKDEDICHYSRDSVRPENGLQ